VASSACATRRHCHHRHSRAFLMRRRREVREISPRNADARLSVSTVSGMPVTTQTTPAI
jgi:hypothetical protein